MSIFKCQSLLAQRAHGDESTHVGQRYANSSKFLKTNFTFGDELGRQNTTYGLDYNTGPMPQWPPSPRIPSIGADKDFKSALKEARREKKKLLQKTNFVFGTDGTSRDTAYHEFTASLPRNYSRIEACPPPQDAKVLPPVADIPAPLTTRSTLREDYMSYCPAIHHTLYGQRVSDLTKVKQVNTRDSVGDSLVGNRKRRLLTRSMVDYRHPIDVYRDNLSEFKTKRVPMNVMNKDSIWEVVNRNDGSSRRSQTITEQRAEFAWPVAGETNCVKRYNKGQHNRIR